jgi:uncharacterized membrane protein
MAVQPFYPQPLSPVRQSRLDNVMRRAGEVALEYWALALTVVLGMIVLAALSVPVLLYLGLDDLARPIFYALHLICAQIPSHSFYILGHQLGMCARNMSIYGSMFVGGLIFVLSKKRLRGIPWWFWLLLILPMAWDGLTQMVGLRESTWELRVLTGTLFGFGNMWFALPFIQRTLEEIASTPVPVLVAPQFAQVQQIPALSPSPFTSMQPQSELSPSSSSEQSGGELASVSPLSEQSGK